MDNIIVCNKCKGSGKFQYKSGMIGYCYQCNGKGKIKRIAHKVFDISIVDNEGERIEWMCVIARSENEAIKKAKKIGERGIYKNQLDTITASERGIEYTYKAI